MQKYFLCSDIHGDYTALRKALEDNRFDEFNPNHILVVAGDIFDRGDECVALYEYLKEMTDRKRAIVLKGNHDNFFIDFLENRNMHLCIFNYINNGLRHTVDDFMHQTHAWDMFINFKYDDEKQTELTQEDWNKEWCEYVKYASDSIKEEYPELLEWFKNLPNYLELKHSIITHGMIDCNSEDWRNPLKGWEDCHWARPEDAIFMKNTTKKHIYVGHIDSDTIRRVLNLKSENYALYTRDSGDITYLDSCTIRTHRVNMVVIDDEELGE